MFRNVYSKEIQDPEQPLLVHRPKDKEVQRVMQVYIYIYIFFSARTGWCRDEGHSIPWPKKGLHRSF